MIIILGKERDGSVDINFGGDKQIELKYVG